MGAPARGWFVAYGENCRPDRQRLFAKRCPSLLPKVLMLREDAARESASRTFSRNLSGFTRFVASSNGFWPLPLTSAFSRTLSTYIRTRGSHHIFRRQGVRELINLQRERGKAKVYQVRQVRQVIVRYGLEGGKE
jgi:hypothetical protein